MASLVDYKGLKVLDSASGPGGGAISDNFTKLADSHPKSFWTATLDPTILDDGSLGKDYQVGSLWLNTGNNTVFICLGNATGNAHWKPLPVILTTRGNEPVIINPNGTGAIQAQINDAMVSGGNIRGHNAVDWQMSRGVATQVASGNRSFIAGGVSNTASGYASHAEGSGAYATAYASHAEGRHSHAIANQSHAEGYGSWASGVAAHAEGSSGATGSHSHAEGSGTNATGYAAHAEGSYLVYASGSNSHAEGNWTDASGARSHAEGYHTYASGDSSHAEGRFSSASGSYYSGSHAEGKGTSASYAAAHAEGAYSGAAGAASHAEGLSTYASGYSAHAEGHSTSALNTASHAEGQDTNAIGPYSHASGHKSVANLTAQWAVASGGQSGAKGTAQHTVSCLFGRTTDATTAVELTLGDGSKLNLQTSQTLSCFVNIVARTESSDTSDVTHSASFLRQVCIRKNGTDTSLIGGVQNIGDINPSSWISSANLPAITAGTTGGGFLKIVVKGAAGYYVRWTAVVSCSEAADSALA